MINRIKYVLTDTDSFSIFSSDENNYISHADIAAKLPGEAVGAGYIDIFLGKLNFSEDGEKIEITQKLKIVCHGYALTLGVHSRGSIDEEIIRKKLAICVSKGK